VEGECGKGKNRSANVVVNRENGVITAVCRTQGKEGAVQNVFGSLELPQRKREEKEETVD